MLCGQFFTCHPRRNDLIRLSLARHPSRDVDRVSKHIAPFFDEDTETLAEIGGDDGVSINQGDTSITAGGNLPDSYPDELIPPNGSLESALSGTENGVESIVAFWTSTTDPGDLLDFFQDAFDELGIEGEQDRLEAGDFNALSISDPDGEPLAGVLVSPSADSESYDVIVTIIGS